MYTTSVQEGRPQPGGRTQPPPAHAEPSRLADAGGRPRPDVQPAFRNTSYPEQVGRAKAELQSIAPVLRDRAEAHPADYLAELAFRGVLQALRALNQTPGNAPFSGFHECPDCSAVTRMLKGRCVFCGFTAEKGGVA